MRDSIDRGTCRFLPVRYARMGLLLVLCLTGCTASPPSDLAGAVASVGASVSPRRLERSAFYVAYPDGTPSDFVRFVFSPLGKAEWVPDDLRDVQGVVLLDADHALELGDGPSVRAVALVQERPDARLRHQVVLRADDERGVVIAAAHETWTSEPVLVREWKLPRVEVAEGVADMARENLDDGVSADDE